MTNQNKGSELRSRIDRHLLTLIERFYATVPYATHQLNDRSINVEYYKRHNVETILRLRMKRTIDALTIHYFTKHDPVLAKKWCAYSEDEMLHDQLFAKDLERLGMTRAQIYSTEPLFATKLLQGYFYYGLEHEGCPLASLCSSYFIEITTVKTQPQWLDNVDQALGPEFTKGQRAHVNHDINEDHTDFVWDVLMTFVKDPQDERKVFDHIDNVYKLFCMYFTELHALTAASPATTSAGEATAQA